MTDASPKTILILVRRGVEMAERVRAFRGNAFVKGSEQGRLEEIAGILDEVGWHGPWDPGRRSVLLGLLSLVEDDGARSDLLGSLEGACEV